MDSIQPSTDAASTAIAVAAQVVSLRISAQDKEFAGKSRVEIARVEAELIGELAAAILAKVRGPVPKPQ
jgi:hypothetical protein